MESKVFVFFDISNDKIRNNVGEICKDYGLVRIQYSGFMGELTKNKREELCLKLKEGIGNEKAILIVQPLCDKCSESAFILGELKEKEVPISKEEMEEKFDLWNMPINKNISEE